MNVSWSATGLVLGALLWGSAAFGQDPAGTEPSGNLPEPPEASAAEPQAESELPPAPPEADRGAPIEDRRNEHGERRTTSDQEGTERNDARDRSARGSAAAGASGRAALGVRFSADSRDLAIGTVVPGSPAARIGLRPGDRIVSVNGQTFADTDAFVDAAGQFALDEDAEIVYLRNGVEQTASVRFAPWGSVYREDGARTHTTMRPSLEGGAPLPADVQSQGYFNRGDTGPQSGQYGGYPQSWTYPQYPRFYRNGYWGRGDFDDDDDDCYDD